MIKAFVKFGIVGASGAVINLAIFNLLLFVPFFHQHYLVTNTIAFLVSVSNNFYWNFKWTFRGKAQHKTFTEKYIKFVLISLINFAINTAILGAMVDQLGLNKRIAKILAIAITSILNFIGNYAITFRDQKTPW